MTCWFVCAAVTVATLACADADVNTAAFSTLVYTLTSSGGGLFSISANVVQLSSGNTLDYETASSYELVVEVSDNAAGTPKNTATTTIQVSVSH